MLVHWIWLATRCGVSDRQKRAVLEACGDAEDVYFADGESYQTIAELSPQAKDALLDKNLAEAESILTQCTDKNIQVCTFHDSLYPARLKHIADPPLVLYYKGTFPKMDAAPVITVVGTRESSLYGNNVARRMGYQIAACGGIVVSGVAKGIDGMAMQGALLAGGTVIGVLGSGVDVVYPKSNKHLFADLERHGCLISEFPPETEPLRWNFPKRNRIMGGLSNGTVVIEAPQKSGSLITARDALELGRDVFVVPGNVDMPGFDGSNALLREGAIPVRNGWDVISEYAPIYPNVVKASLEEPAVEDHKELPKVAEEPMIPAKRSVSAKEKQKKPIDKAPTPPYSDLKAILDTLSDSQRAIVELLTEPCVVDEIIAQTGLSAAKVSMDLTLLQVRGIIKRLPGNRITLK